MFADLHHDKIDLVRYLPNRNCYECGFSCEEFARLLMRGSASLDSCPYLSSLHKRYLEIVIHADEMVPKVPISVGTVATKTGLVRFGKPKRLSPVLVTSNYPYTQALIGSVLEKADLSCYLLVIDTDGYCVEMAVYLGLFNGERVRDAIRESKLERFVSHRKLIIPGIAGKFRNEIEGKTGWEVLVGPLCAVEIPIFLLLFWKP